MVASMAETGDRTDAYGMRESHVLMVQPTNGDAVPAAAVVVDDNGHLAVSSTEFVPGTTVRVLCGEKYKSASVVRHDSDTGLAILKLDDPYGSPSNPSLVDVGDPVNLVAYPDGTRAMNQATVTSGVLDAAALVETTVVSTHTTETSTTTTEPDLRVMAITDGSAEAIEALPGAAVTTSGGQVVGLVVAAGPVAGMVEPLDGVRRRAAMMLED
jgi:hypothetical protein